MSENILLNVLDWNFYDECEDDEDSEEYEEASFVIEAFGKTKDDKSVYLKITDFTPYFFVEIPKTWEDRSVKKFIDYITSKVYGKYKCTLINYDVVKKRKFYGFTAGKKFKFLRLIFSTLEGMNKFKWIFNTKHKIPGLCNYFEEYKPYESNFPSMLRFMHIRDIDACGWIKIDKGKYNKLSRKKFNTDIAIECKFNNIDREETNDISKIKILSYDLECTSEDGNFPQADRKGDAIIQIGSTFSYNGDENCYFKHIITLGSCDDIENAEVECYETEEEVILAWQNLVIKHDPDIITGWNIYGFDNKYIHDRAEFLKIDNKFGRFSRIKNKICNFVDTQLSSSALGDNKIRYYNAFGRIQIDLMKVVMRDYKLDSFKLDKVAENFLQGKVINIKDDELELDSVKDIIVNGYIKLIDSDDELVEDGNKFKILKIKKNKVKLDRVPDCSDSKLVWTMAKDDVSPNDIFRLQKGSSSDRKIIAQYCIQDCALVNKLIARLCVVINSIGMSNVCSVPLSYLFLRGQGIKIHSLVAKECRKMNYLIPVVKKNNDEVSLGYEGATVFTPDIGFYERPISVDDYSSLYPSCMIQKNLSHETLVNNDKYDNLDEYKYYNCEFNNADGSKTKCRFAKKKNGDKGIMPMILDKLLAQRKFVKKLMKNESDSFKKSIYDGLQLAYKVTANSLYGQIGSSVSPIYCKEIAASTTSTGREMLELARDYITNVFPGIIESLYEGYKNKDEASVKKILEEELVETLQNEDYYKEVKGIITKILGKVSCNIDVIYGDTDSIFIDWGMKQGDEYYKGKDVLEFSIDLGKISGDFIKSKLESPQDLEYEKTFYPFCILSKKRYVGNKYEFDVNKFSQNSMGIVLKRRDNAKIVKKIFGGMVDILLNEIDVDKAVNFIKSSISDLLKGKYPLYNFITSKTLKSQYADRTRLAHVCLADRMRERDPGSAPEINERVQYVAIVVNKNEIIKRKEEEFRVKMNKIINDEIKEDKKIRGENIDRMIYYLCKLDNSKKFLEGIDKIKKDLIFSVSQNNTDNIRNRIRSECESLYKGRVLQGDSIEHPDYIKENNLRVDYLFYLTNQIMNPTIQFLELLVKNPNEIFNEAISMENNRREGNQPITNWINVKKNNNTSLVIKKTPSKNLSKYYLGDEEVDFDKLGDLDEKKKSKNNKSKLYLEL